MSFNYALCMSNFMGYNSGIIIIPARSIVTLSFDSSAALESIILISKQPASCVIHEANSSTTNGLDDFIIKNKSCCPMVLYASGWYINNNTLLPSTIQSTVTDENNFSYGFNDGGSDTDFNYIVVNINITPINSCLCQ